MTMKYIERKTYRGGTEIAVYETEELNQQARFAMQLIERLALGAEIDGEDRAGRSKARPLTEKEIVSKACELADLAFKEFRASDWILDIPAPKPPVDKE